MAKPRKLGTPSAYTQNSMYDLRFKRKMYLRKQKIMKSNGRQGETIAAVKLKSEVSKNAMSL
mgnify:CR=1 FL=1|nr:MAG TPA: hypothetical protein [Caudoviricetes sp.]